MEDYQISKDMQLGQQANELLENPTLKQAFDEIQQEIFKVWQETKSDQTQERETAWLNHRAMQLFKIKLEGWILDGKIATAELEKKLRQEKKPSQSS